MKRNGLGQGGADVRHRRQARLAGRETMHHPTEVHPQVQIQQFDPAVTQAFRERGRGPGAVCCAPQRWSASATDSLSQRRHRSVAMAFMARFSLRSFLASRHAGFRIAAPDAATRWRLDSPNRRVLFRLLCALGARAGDLNAPAAPASASSALYTLEDIFNRRYKDDRARTARRATFWSRAARTADKCLIVRIRSGG
jgi:hypothetical protein